MNKKSSVFYNVFVNICLTVKILRIKVLDWVSILHCLFSRLIGGFSQAIDEVDLFETICPF